MIQHDLHIGQIIWDDYDKRWGKIILLPDGLTTFTDEYSDAILTYTEVVLNDEDEWEELGNECEILAEEAYPLVEDVYFWGNEVCLEINRDAFDEDHDYDYYCPAREENCWKFETNADDEDEDDDDEDDEDDYINLEEEEREFGATLKDNPIIVDAYGIYVEDENLCASIPAKDIDVLMDRLGAGVTTLPYLNDLMMYRNDISEDGEIIDFVIPFNALSEDTMLTITDILANPYYEE